MAELPDYLDVRRHRDVSFRAELTARWAVLGLLAAIAVAALFGLFGQRARESVASAGAAELEVSAPTRLRGGLFFQGRFTVDARESIENATLVLDPGWLENMHINTIEPAPTEEASRDGDLELPSARSPPAIGWSSTCSSRSTRRTWGGGRPTSRCTTARPRSPPSTGP